MYVSKEKQGCEIPVVPLVADVIAGVLRPYSQKCSLEHRMKIQYILDILKPCT